MSRPASYEEIARLLEGAGAPADAPTLDRILELGASASEISEAARLLRSGAQLDEPAPAASSARVAEVHAILAERAASPHDGEDGGVEAEGDFVARQPYEQDYQDSITAD